uniref:Uncharacterized protein n=1 Tax=viral metagenome TaxID=1070528 RepID=A0A6C0LYR0_9ZZZZ
MVQIITNNLVKCMLLFCAVRYMCIIVNHDFTVNIHILYSLSFVIGWLLSARIND